MRDSIEQLERDTFEEEGPPIHPPSDMIAYNELRSCADLYRMYEQKILTIQPEFQRDVVWPATSQTRFIDSLIKQLPIPSMCFSLDYEQQKWMVIDGLQRISTIIRFLEPREWKLSKLNDIDQRISGQSTIDLKKPDSDLNTLYRRVENLTLPITVLRCDSRKKNHNEYLFMIFHRLNTGGMKLNNQEIRNCIYGGPFNNLLKRLDAYELWRTLNRMKPKASYRFTKQELILRFFAFLDSYAEYDGMLAKFLNDYMETHRHISEHDAKGKEDTFCRAVRVVLEKVFGSSAPGKLSITLLEATLFGVARNLERLEGVGAEVLTARYNQLRSSEHFADSILREGLSKKPRVIDRLRAAEDILGGR